METKVCKVCERSLPLEKFRFTRNGVTRAETCEECRKASYDATKQTKRMEIERQRHMYDSEFDSKEPVDVIKLMTRAKKWLENKGYEITLRGVYTVRKEVKFNEL